MIKSPFLYCLLFSTLLCACSLDVFTPREMIVKEGFHAAVEKVVKNNADVLCQEYHLEPNKSTEYFNGEKSVIHSIYFACENNHLDKVDWKIVDSVSLILAKTIAEHIENDTSFNNVIISMLQVQDNLLLEKTWNYHKAFEIGELKEK